MSKTRNNHYVPQWYQEGFFEPGQNTYSYLDLTPDKRALPDGRVITQKSRFISPTERCFRQRDLYSTFFGMTVNDEIERKLFGKIDSKGAEAVRAFIGSDVNEWIRHFETFYTYIDAQKIRTPKGHDWLKAQYPSLDHNELMWEMQGIRTLHCTIWTGGVREIVSAEDSDVKFIVTDHPVTVYNHAVPSNHALCENGNEPSIALKGSQTLFPLNRDFCLILTNLEYARDMGTNPLEKRTFARNFNYSLVNASALLRERKLNALEVSRINYILKKRAKRFIAAGKEEWLHPENTVKAAWRDLRDTLAPPSNSLWRFGGKILSRFEDGRVHHQDEFGRTEEPWDFLLKNVDEKSLRPSDACGCGSGRRYRDCCKGRPQELRPSWRDRSIRDRNLFLFKVLVKELDLETGKTWVEIRQSLTDEQIKRVYGIFGAIWPRETDILSLLPKPDGRARAVYTGCIHPSAIIEFALGASLYFGELLIEHPFINPLAMNDKYSPVEHPRAYRQEFLKSVLMFLYLIPLVEAGLVNLVPDPCNFDTNLRDQMMRMARARTRGFKYDPKKDPRMRELMEEDGKRGIMAVMPAEAFRRRALEANPNMDDAGLDRLVEYMERMKRDDPLAVLQEGEVEPGEDGGLMSMQKLSPNFEMAMYLAKAVGGVIVTDSLHRWEEIQRTIRWRPPRPLMTLQSLAKAIDEVEFSFVQTTGDVLDIAMAGSCGGYPALMQEAFRYASRVGQTGEKANVEAGIAARFSRLHVSAQAAIAKKGVEVTRGRILCAFPWGGFQDNTVNRLLLMSSSDHHLPNVPMAFFIKRPDIA